MGQAQQRSDFRAYFLSPVLTGSRAALLEKGTPLAIAIPEFKFYQDPTTEDKNWVVVDLSPVETLKKPVTLETIKNDERLKDISGLL